MDANVCVCVCVVGLSDVVDKAMPLLNLVNLVEGFCSKFH